MVCRPQAEGAQKSLTPTLHVDAVPAQAPASRKLDPDCPFESLRKLAWQCVPPLPCVCPHRAAAVCGQPALSLWRTPPYRVRARCHKKEAQRQHWRYSGAHELRRRLESLCAQLPACRTEQLSTLAFALNLLRDERCFRPSQAIAQALEREVLARLARREPWQSLKVAVAQVLEVLSRRGEPLSAALHDQLAAVLLSEPDPGQPLLDAEAARGTSSAEALSAGQAQKILRAWVHSACHPGAPARGTLPAMLDVLEPVVASGATHAKQPADKQPADGSVLHRELATQLSTKRSAGHRQDLRVHGPALQPRALRHRHLQAGRAVRPTARPLMRTRPALASLWCRRRVHQACGIRRHGAAELRPSWRSCDCAMG